MRPFKFQAQRGAAADNAFRCLYVEHKRSLDIPRVMRRNPVVPASLCRKIVNHGRIQILRCGGIYRFDPLNIHVLSTLHGACWRVSTLDAQSGPKV